METHTNPAISKKHAWSWRNQSDFIFRQRALALLKAVRSFADSDGLSCLPEDAKDQAKHPYFATACQRKELLALGHRQETWSEGFARMNSLTPDTLSPSVTINAPFRNARSRSRHPGMAELLAPCRAHSAEIGARPAPSNGSGRLRQVCLLP